MFRTLASSRRRKLTGIRSMFPQSRNTSTRSTTSAGASWNTSSRGRNWYSTGSGNSFAARNITESLPSCSRMWCIASSEPRASPSGASWVVSRKRSFARSSWAMSASDASVRRTTAVASLILEQPREADAPFGCIVVVEGQRRSALDPHLARDRSLEDAVRGTQPGERGLALGLAAQHAHVHARRAQVRACLHRGHRHEPDPRVLELGRDRRSDHLAHELVHPSHALGHSRATIAKEGRLAGRFRPLAAHVLEAQQVAVERAATREAR